MYIQDLRVSCLFIGKINNIEHVNIVFARSQLNFIMFTGCTANIYFYLNNIHNKIVTPVFSSAAKQCPHPDPLSNGELYYEATEFQSMINYTCDEG